MIVTDAQGQGRRVVGVDGVTIGQSWSPDSRELALIVGVSVDERVFTNNHIAVANVDGTPGAGVSAVGGEGRACQGWASPQIAGTVDGRL